jgi:protein gp37
MSAISWTDETHNCVIGCSKVSAECTSCYAEAQGASLSRRFVNGAGARYLNVIDGKRWNGRTYVDHDYMARTTVTKRKRDGKWWRPARIFLGSMTDMLHETLNEADMWAVGTWMGRQSLGERQGPIWQIVTKRPERAPLLLPVLVEAAERAGVIPRIHLLTTVGVRSSLLRLDALLECHGMPGVEVLGVSAEPLLEAVDFRPWLATGRLGWIIPGGESGPKARPCHEDWIRDVVQACAEYGVPCWTKQLGAHALYSARNYRRPLADPSGSDPAEWPVDLRVQVWP